jgi:tight adherence protein C
LKNWIDAMLWTLTILTFLGTAAVVTSLFYAFTPGAVGIAGRLSRLFNSVTEGRKDRFSDKQKERAQNALASVGKIVTPVPKEGVGTTRTALLLARAGYRNADATLVMNGVKVLLPICVVAGVYVTDLYRVSPPFIFGGALLLGYLLPDIWLMWRVSRRQHRLRLALPDGLDLLVICVEAGLGLDQALLRVSQELKIAHPELSDELQLVNVEMRLGKTRLEALRELARRTGLDDIKSLVAMLIQTERFGTSIAQSLRVHSDELRIKRRQRAEEMAAKTTVKMVPVLVFFIFPALMVVILGPAVIAIMRNLFH